MADLPENPPLDDPRDRYLSSAPEPVCEECGMSMDDEEVRHLGGHADTCSKVWVVTDWNDQ